MIHGKPTLVIDEVGVGKTMQAVMVVALREYYREYFNLHGKFPGYAGEQGWKSEETPEDNFAARPMLIVCPVSLSYQWPAELRRYLCCGTFDIFPYEHSFSSQKTYFEDVWEKSEQPITWCILLSTTTAIIFDFSELFLVPKKRHLVPTRRSSNIFESKVLEVNDIQHVTLTGDTSNQDIYTEILNKFKQARRDEPRVLLMSMVGLVGLNIADANMLIIMDTLWSAQEDTQLVGHMWRHSQPKDIDVYCIDSKDTHDIFLNTISLSKVVIQGFTGTLSRLRKIFNNNDGEDDIDVDNDDEAQPTGRIKAKPTPLTKRKNARKDVTAKKVASSSHSQVNKSKINSTPIPESPSTSQASTSGHHYCNTISPFL
ncbi:hypothetical protein CERSUDRAFT_98506 [Gelatoporia subvermispora B]|uniref:Helicase C-terminal domain-containing protein n=1 Tax=Ceriporiopsis subvermispora (strain B) TaxID=914234 RepID=M2R3B0_CERS8|nr:hypothetical protein CERSUDRAFT_98506 [Gelatoporia subvermispora B]